MKRHFLRRVTLILLAFAILFGTTPTNAFAESPRSTLSEEKLAYALKALGLFSGVGANADGTTNFDLNRKGTRVEALIMLIRLLGEEEDAKACKDICIFTDVPEWARCYVAYAFGNDYTRGSTYDDTKGIYLFGTGPATAEMYSTFVLRALGYSDINGQDFSWNNSLLLAKTLGIVTEDVNVDDFWRADIVTISFNALYTEMKGANQTLADKLFSADMPSQTQADITTAATGYTILPSGEIPAPLLGRKLSDIQIKELLGKDPSTLKAELTTVEDVVAWFNAGNFSYMDGAWWTNNPDSNYGRYESGADILYSEQNLKYTGQASCLGVDNVSISAAWLLQDDFIEAGILSAMVIGKLPNYNVAYLKLDSTYYIIDFATLITNTSNRVRTEMMSSIKAEDLYSLSSIIRDTGNEDRFVLLGTTSALDEQLHYAKYAQSAEFVLSDKVKVMYSSSSKLTLEESIASVSNMRDFNISSYKLPSGLGSATLTFEQASELVGKDAEKIADAVRTLADMLLYMYVSGFKIDNGDQQISDGNVSWHYNYSAITSLSNGKANCGATANTVRYLLDGDYDEVGFVCHTYKNGGGGGHVYNYIKSGTKYYVVDMTAYTESNYSTSVIALLELDSLSDYGDNYQRMTRFGDYLPVIYTYQSKQEIPLAWNNIDTYTTWYPTGTIINTISEDIANGYTIKYRSLPTYISEKLEAIRSDYLTSNNDMALFKGISSYNLPPVLGGVTLSNDQVKVLAGSGATLEEVAASVKTVGDLMMYLYAAGFQHGDKDILTSGNDGQEWRCNLFADAAFRQRTLSCGAVANLVAYLLDGDYEDIGFVCHTYEFGGGGGHVYNYVEVNGDFYVVDLTQYLAATYSVTGSYVVSVGNNLENYAAKYSQMYSGDAIRVIYAYSLPEELPISWSTFDDVYVTYLPESKKDDVIIILETGVYSVGFANLSSALWEYINTKR